MDDTVQVKCTKCKGTFRERARRLQDGYSRQCPTCEVVLFFNEDSPDVHIRGAMRTARRLRQELRDAHNEVRSRITTSRHSGRHAPERRDGPDGRDA